MLFIDAVAFQLLWLIAVQGDDGLAALALAVHLLIYRALAEPTRAHWLFIATIGSGGWLLETLVGTSGFIAFHGAQPIALHGWTLQLAPLWMGCLWLGFAATLLRSLFVLVDRLFLAALLGGCAGPLSYWAGGVLSNSPFLQPAAQVLVFEACLWALLLPLLLRIAALADRSADSR